MKTIILSILTMSSIASANLGEGTYLGRTSTWFGSLTAKTCVFTVGKASFSIETKNADGSSIKKDVVNTAAGKLQSQVSKDGNISIINFKEIGSSFSLQASIEMNQAEGSINWSTLRYTLDGSKANQIKCIGMKRLN